MTELQAIQMLTILNKIAGRLDQIGDLLAYIFCLVLCIFVFKIVMSYPRK